MSTIQTNRSGLIHILTEMQVFRDQIPTQVQCKQEDYIDWESVIAQRRCPEEMYSQIVDFLQKPLPEQYPYMWLKFDPVVDANARVRRKDLPWWLIFPMTPYLITVRLCRILFKCCNVSTKSPRNWSVLYTNPYPSNITMFRFVVVANFMNSLRVAYE